jgi:imidazolonepropionase-like amidohydrolase
VIAVWLAQGLALVGGVVEVGDGRQRTGVTILVRDGKIQAVGEGLELPSEATVVRVPAGSHVAPGFIDLHSHLGMAYERDEHPRAATPQMRAADGFATDHEDVRRARSSGVTAVALSPGDANVVGGALSLVRMAPGYLDEVLLEPVAALKLTLSRAARRPDREPTSLAGALDLIERELADESSETRLRCVVQKKPVWIAVETPEEIARALKLKTERGLRVVLVGAAGIDTVADAVAAAGVPVVLGPLRTTSDERALRRPGLLAGAGVVIGFASNAPATSEEQLRQSAILAVRHGLPAQAALRALTVDAARILGVEARLGAVEPGRDADLVVTTGPPLSPTARVERVVAAGRVVYAGSAE